MQSAYLNRVEKSRELFFPSKSRHDESVDAHERPITPTDWIRRDRHPLSTSLCVRTRTYIHARARATLGYADERQIKMHNPGKSFRIFHNGREISLLAARAIHPLGPTATAPRTTPRARTTREFVDDRVLRTRAHTHTHETRHRGDRDGEREDWHLLHAERGRKRNARGERRICSKGEQGREKEKRTWKRARQTRADTRVSAGRGGARGTRIHVYTRVHTRRGIHAKRVQARARAIRGMRPGLNYVPRNAFSRESHCERSV